MTQNFVQQLEQDFPHPFTTENPNPLQNGNTVYLYFSLKSEHRFKKLSMQGDLQRVAWKFAVWSPTGM